MEKLQKKLEPFLKKHYKKLMLIPILIMAISLIFVLSVKSNTGEFLQKDVSLSGGMSLTIYTEEEINFEQLENNLKKDFPEIVIRSLSEFGTEKTIGLVLETSSMDEESLKSQLENNINIKITDENSSIEVVGSSLGESFYKQMVKALIYAFIFMSLAILITFRKMIPSFAVVVVALGDLIVTVAIINILNMRVSSAGIAALLLLIGYSIDTDVLLTTRILKKREGNISNAVTSSIKTGLTMTITTIAALSVAYFVSTSLILKQMFSIILIGLVVDIILTYLLNAPMLAAYAKKMEDKKQ